MIIRREILAFVAITLSACAGHLADGDLADSKASVETVPLPPPDPTPPLNVAEPVATSTTANPDPPVLTFSGTLEIDATNKGEATKGTIMRDGEEVATTDIQLKSAQDHVKQYSGATTFAAQYSITLKADKTLDKGTVKFITRTFTNAGTVQKDSFTTLDIKITAVKLTKDDKLESFEFSANDWYPMNAVINKGISGSINLVTKDTSYTAVYQGKSTTAIYTYTITGKITDKPAPKPMPDGDPNANPDVSPNPDPSCDPGGATTTDFLSPLPTESDEP